MKKAIKFYNDMVAKDMVHKTWTHEDYEDVTVYGDVNGDIVCVQRDAGNNIIDAWIE